MHGKLGMVVSIAVAPWLVGCVGMPSKADNLASQQSAEQKEKLKSFDYAGLTARDKNVSLTFMKSILPGDQNYLPKNGAWAEYTVEVRSFAPSVTIKDLRLIGPTGTFVNSASRIEELENTPSIQGATGEMLAVSMGTTAIGSAVAYSGMAAAAPVALFAAPLLMVGYLFNEAGEADRQIAWAKEFQRRAMTTTTLDKDASVSGNVYFPMIERPRGFVFDYTMADGSVKQLRLNLARADTTQATGGSPDEAEAKVPVVEKPEVKVPPGKAPPKAKPQVSQNKDKSKKSGAGES